jgi:hypothetical protein
VTVSCASKHRLRWQDGKLLAVDHPDAESELVLAALGGEHPECVRLVMAWNAHSSDLDVLAFGPRSAADTISLPPQFPARHSSPMVYGPRGVTATWGSFGASGRLTARRADSGRLELLELLSLDQGLAFRLTATAAANATASRARPRLTAALTGRLAPAARTWLDIDPDRVDARIHDGDGWGELQLTSSGELRAALPFQWLAGVWAPGLAVVDHRLVVGVTGVTWPRAEVLAVSRPGTDPAPLHAICKNGQWSVARNMTSLKEAT